MSSPVLFYVRVKLPNAAAYPSCPSGDTEYEDDYDKVMKAAVPTGFAVIKPRSGHRWAVDSEGFTLVPLSLEHTQTALDTMVDQVRRLEEWRDSVLEKVTAFAKEVLP